MLARFFRLEENGTTVGREMQAGLTTFAAMAYILAVNPTILAAAGMDRSALVTITALSSAIATVLMVFMTNYPLALAPGMGTNAMFAFYICGALSVPWPDALGMVAVNGCIFLLLSLTGVRESIMRAIPYSLKMAITCGIGVFIAFIGLKNSGIIVSDPNTYVRAGDFAGGSVALCLSGLVVTAVLVARRVPGAIVLGMVITAFIGLFVPAGGHGPDGHAIMVTRLPESIIGLPASPAPHFLKLTFTFLRSWDAFARALPVILALLMLDMFDNIGTLIGVTKRAGLLDKDGNLPRAGRALVADSIAAVVSAFLGTSTVVSYIESASGVAAGGRTGLTGLTVAALMLLALFFSPLILSIPAAATAPALIIVGVFMFQSVAEIRMDDFVTAAPAVLTIMTIPLTFSISDGIGIGVVSAALLGLCTGRARSMTLVGYVIAAIFFLRFFHLPPFHGAM